MLTGLSVTAADAPTAWKAGVATAVITPQQAMWMAGYANRTLHDAMQPVLTRLLDAL